MKVLGWAYIVLGILVTLFGFGLAVSDIQIIIGLCGVNMVALGVVIKR